MPAVTRLCFRIQSGVNYLDLSKQLATFNRSKDYHQKMIYSVIGGMVVDNSTNVNKIEVSTAPNTWYVRAAINRGFNKWKKHRAQLLEQSNTKPSEHSDFKVYLNDASSANYRDAIGTNRQPLTIQEWTYSTLQNDLGDSKSFMIIGDQGNNRYSLTKGWLSNMHRPQASEPVMPDLDGNAVLDYKEDFLNTLHGTNDNVDEQIEDLVEQNDSVTYELEDMAFGVNDANNLQSQCLTYVDANNPSMMIAGFEAVCGLVKVTATQGDESNGALLYLDVVSTGRKF